jgi:hypothetical protein
MIPITPLRPDGDKIIELIKSRDPQGEWGAVARFARRVHCHPQSLRNIGNGHRGASLEFLGYIAAVLRVDITEIIRGGEPAAPDAGTGLPEAA